MPIDLKQFHQTYFEECFENLQVMESGMLDLSGGDLEQINVIFRAAHSIKGASSTFGFDGIAGFTHQLETLLDEMRKGLRPADREAVDLLLRSVDCLGEMITSSRQGVAVDQERVGGLNREYERLKSPPPSSPSVVDELLGQQQVVIKSLETNFKRIEGISGATILGDGTVALILDIAGMIAFSRRAAQSSGSVNCFGSASRLPLGECV